MLPDNYILEKRKIKHARIRVSDNLSVRVLVPNSFTEKDIQSLIHKKRKWIDKHLNTFGKKAKSIKLHKNQILLFGNRYSYFYSNALKKNIVINNSHRTIQSRLDLLNKKEQTKWYKQFAKEFLNARTKELSKQHKFRYNKIFIRDQRTKWGNCSKEKNLSFNWRLIKTPLFVIDYLIIHELIHTKIMNHHYKFWNELKSYCPDYQMAIDWLDNYGKSIL